MVPSPITGQGTNSPQATQCSQKKKERERKRERKEIKAENYPSLKKETGIQAQEGQSVPNKMNPNRSTSRHIIKMGKTKARIIKAAREKQRVNYKGILIRLSTDFSTETLKAKRECGEIQSKIWKGKTCNLGYSIWQDVFRTGREK